MTVDWPRNSQIIVLTVLDQVSILDFQLKVLMCNFGITIFRMGNLLQFVISLFYFFMLFPWIPRTLIDGLILSSNTSVENWKWFIWHTSWLSSDLISKEICDCETKKRQKNSLKAPHKIDLHWNNKCAVNTFWFNFWFTCHVLHLETHTVFL